MFNDTDLFTNPHNLAAFKNFDQACASDPEIYALVETMARASNTHPEQFKADPNKAYFSAEITAAHLLTWPLSYFLWRLAKDFCDHRRAIKNIEIAERQAEFIETMVASGFERNSATQVSIAMFDNIAKPGQGSATLEKLSSFLPSQSLLAGTPEQNAASQMLPQSGLAQHDEQETRAD